MSLDGGTELVSYAPLSEEEEKDTHVTPPANHNRTEEEPSKFEKNSSSLESGEAKSGL